MIEKFAKFEEFEALKKKLTFSGDKFIYEENEGTWEMIDLCRGIR